MKGMNKPGKGLEGIGSLWKSVKILTLVMIKFEKKHDIQRFLPYIMS